MSVKFRIKIDGEWTLEDLYLFPHTFSQVYYVVYSLLPDLSEESVERISNAYSKFPWRGGYSAVNFYNQLMYAVPRQQRPVVEAIRFESPGFIDLGLFLGAAFTVSRAVKSVASAIGECNATYNGIHTELQKRKLLRLEVKQKELQLKRDDLAFVKEATTQMTELLHMMPVAELNARTGNEFVSLKILLSLYRRVRTLVDYQKRGKAKF